MDEGLVYELTSILYENAGSLGRQHPSLFAMSRDRFMYSALPIPLHPAPVSPLITALCASHFHAVLHPQTTFIIKAR